MPLLAHIGTRSSWLRGGCLLLLVLSFGCDEADEYEPSFETQDERFALRLRGDLVLVDVRLPDGMELFRSSCDAGWRSSLQKRGDDQHWTVLRDDRPSNHGHSGYYLGGTYVAPTFNLGCDVVGCYRAAAQYDELELGRAREYVKTGSMPPPAGARPANGPGSGIVADPADVIEMRPFHGELRAHFKYSTRASCEAPKEVTLTIQIPEGLAPEADVATEADAATEVDAAIDAGNP